MRKLSILVLVAVLASLLPLGGGTAQAAALCVNPGGTGGCFSTIEAAIAAATTGDTVNVGAGTYAPVGGRLIINKSITVQADPSLAVRPKIITNYMGYSDCAIQIAADNVVFQGFEVDNSAAYSTHLKGYIVGDYGSAKNGWTIRNNDIHNGRNAIRPLGNNVTIEYNNLHETESDLINCEYGTCFGLKVKYNWLHSHHSDLGGKPAGLTYNVSSTGGADVEITYNYAWANRTFVDFQNNGGLSPANHILVAHNTVDFWIGDLPDPIVGSENAEQMSIAWWAGVGQWNGPNFDIRDNMFTRQKWYAVVDTDSLLQGQVTLRNNLFWKWYLNDTWYPSLAYPNEWPGSRGAVGWNNMGTGNEFVMQASITADPLYASTGTNPDEYYALTCGSPALAAATDGTNIGAWQGTLACDDEPPIVSNVLATPNPVAVSTPVALSATITDPTPGSGVASAVYTIDGGAPVAMLGTFGGATVNATADIAAFLAAGVHTICVHGTDGAGNVGAESCILLAVYDPSGGFVTGGGWINSAAGAYTADPTLTGKATFGFVSRYQKGANIPTGNTEFMFKAGSLNFHSTSYDWLVVTGSNYARFKGTGTINGAGEYKFMIWAGDGTGTDGADTFRIKIWGGDEDSPVYDNGMDQPIGGGNIVVKTK